MTRRNVTRAMRKLPRRPRPEKKAKPHLLRDRVRKLIVHREKSKWIGMVSSVERDN